jgi:oligo-1,6-glucosidase
MQIQRATPDDLPSILHLQRRAYQSEAELYGDPNLPPLRAFGVTLAQAPLFTDARRGELSMIFHFDVVRLDRDNWRKTDWTLPALKAAYARIDQAAGLHGWSTSYLCNHDNPRAVSHFGDDGPAWRERSAKALATLMLTQRATPFLYQGDELGMTNYPFRSVEDYNDVEVRGHWRQLVERGRVPAAEYLAHVRQTSRDNARTPMQWSAGPHGGFTTGQPWLAVNPNYVEIKAAAQGQEAADALVPAPRPPAGPNPTGRARAGACCTSSNAGTRALSPSPP